MAVALLQSLGVNEVQGKSGLVSVNDLLKDTTAIGLYFSAHWCPPCRGFTPVLGDLYKKLKANGQSIEIIFISSDRDQASCDDYYKEMPWHVVPFSNRSAKEKMAEKYGVRGIPTLIILDQNGEIKDKNARDTAARNADTNVLPAAWK